MYVMHHQLVRVRFGSARSEIDLLIHLDKGTETKITNMITISFTREVNDFNQTSSRPSR